MSSMLQAWQDAGVADITPRVRNRIRNLKSAGALPALLIIAALAACSTNPDAGLHVVNSPPPTRAAAPATSATSAAPLPSPAPTVRPIGYTFGFEDQNSNVYLVTLIKVLDPAQGDGTSSLNPGQKFVAAIFKVAAQGDTASDNADSDASLVGSDGQNYQPVTDTISGYTNFDAGYGGFTVSGNGSEVGEVTFEIPAGVTVKQVQWQGQLFTSNQSFTWTVGNHDK